MNHRLKPGDFFTVEVVMEKTPRGKTKRALHRQFRVVVTEKERIESEPVGPGFNVNWDGLMTRKA